MRFFFDESGRFDVPNQPTQLHASVVTGIAVSDVIEAELHNAFQAFVHELNAAEKVRDEPKGRLLSNTSRETFCMLLERFSQRGFLVAALFVDMSLLPIGTTTFGAASFAATLASLAETATDPINKNELQSLSAKFRQLSEPQSWRLFTWALCLKYILDKTLRWLCSEGGVNGSDNVSFEIDEVEARKHGLEPEVFRHLIHPWLAAYSRQIPTVINEETYININPFTRKYLRDDGVDLESLLHENIHFSDSMNNWGLQIADIISNIIFRAIHIPENNNGEMDIFRRLARACLFDTGEGIKLLFASSNRALGMQTHSKYAHVFKTQNAAYSGREHFASPV